MDIKKAQEALKRLGELIDYDPTIMGITQSALNTWMDCEKKARYYLRGLQSAGNSSSSKALVFGSVFHDFQDRILNDIRSGVIKSPEDVYVCITEISFIVYEDFKWDEAFKEANAIGQANITESFKFMEQLMPRYFEFWKKDFDNMRLIAIEQEFKTSIHNVPIRGKRDGIVEMTDVANKRMGTYLLEHKTKARMDTEALQKSLPYMYQVLVYVLTYFLEHDHLMQGVCYNVFRKPGLRKKVSESTDQYITRCMEDIDKRPQYYFVRFWHEFDPTQIALFAESFSNQVLKFKQWSEQDEALDVRNTSKCQAMFGTCPYLDYCTSNEKDIAGLQIKDKLFSELS
jgi:hypothetical protein